MITYHKIYYHEKISVESRKLNDSRGKEYYTFDYIELVISYTKPGISRKKGGCWTTTRKIRHA